MKRNVILLIMIVSSLLIGCEVDKSGELSPKTQLIKKLINTPEVQTKSGKVIVLKTQFCNDIDCVAYFQDYADRIQVFSKADVFIRAITNYVEIEKLDEENGLIVLRKRNGKGYDRFEIKI